MRIIKLQNDYLAERMFEDAENRNAEADTTEQNSGGGEVSETLSIRDKQVETPKENKKGKKKGRN